MFNFPIPAHGNTELLGDIRLCESSRATQPGKRAADRFTRRFTRTHRRLAFSEVEVSVVALGSSRHPRSMGQNRTDS